MQSNTYPPSRLALRLPLNLHALPPSTDSRHDPWQQIEVPTADKDTSPKSQLCAIDCHAQDIEFRLEKHRHKRKQITRSINAHKDEAYASYSTMRIDVPIVAKNPGGEQNRCENSHECQGPCGMSSVRRLQGKYQSNFDPSHQSTHAYQDDCTFYEAPMLPIVVALAPS